jgi:NAD(P)-dependent dehydrogenase (short-subunit alcohol dehydrogenase family)
MVPHIDVLINNAGVSNRDHPDEPPSKVDRQEFLQVPITSGANQGCQIFLSPNIPKRQKFAK